MGRQEWISRDSVAQTIVGGRIKKSRGIQIAFSSTKRAGPFRTVKLGHLGITKSVEEGNSQPMINFLIQARDSVVVKSFS